MAFVIKFVKGVRNHWKKSTFAAIAIAYGVNYAKEYYETRELMRLYCLEAAKYGETSVGVHDQLKKVTVILNPNANRRKATSQFEKYCAPILNLAGVCVDVVQTQSQGHAKSLILELEQTDAIVVAGGDGTLSEVVTGLMRRATNDQHMNPCPVGILPLGRTNTLAKILFPGGDSLQTVKSLADASIAIVRENTKVIDVMKIEIIEPEVAEDGQINEVKKPVYAVSSLEWGAYRDAHAKRDKYWYFGSLRNYMTYLFNGYKNSLGWDCNAEINYLLPCEGCSNCHVNQVIVTNKRWWHSFIPRANSKTPDKDYSKVINNKCAEQHEKEIKTSDLTLLTRNISGTDSLQPELHLKFGPYMIPYLDFVTQGWHYEKGQDKDIVETINLRQVEIIPKNTNDKEEIFYSIDKEDYKVKPIRVTLLPQVLKVFCKENA